MKNSKRHKLDEDLKGYFQKKVKKEEIPFSKWIDENLTKYGHLFLGTNDFEMDLINLDQMISQNQIFQQSEKVALVSNGWVFIMNSIFKHNKNIKQLIFYDTNPIMLLIYDTIVQLLLISESRQDFIQNLFCRKISGFELDSNQNQQEYLSQDYDKNLYKQVCDKLPCLSKQTYQGLFLKYAIQSSEFRNVYPTYFFDEKKNKLQNLIDGKKMHTTQKIDNIHHYFTSYYYNIVEPFKTDQQFKFFIQRLKQCKFNYLCENVQNIMDDPLFDQHKNLILYIDGIDDEYCFYLYNTRDVLFKRIQTQIEQKIFIISTKSGITQIDKDQIIIDKQNQKKYKVIKNSDHIYKIKLCSTARKLLKKLNLGKLSIQFTNSNDYEGMKLILQDKRVMENIGNGTIDSDEKIQKWVKTCDEDNILDNQDRNYFNYTLKVDDQIKGLFRCSKQSLGQSNKEFCLRLILSRDIWNKGYGSEFMQNYCLPKLKQMNLFKKVQWACLAEFQSSNQLAINLNGQLNYTKYIFDKKYNIYDIYL